MLIFAYFEDYLSARSDFCLEGGEEMSDFVFFVAEVHISINR